MIHQLVGFNGEVFAVFNDGFSNHPTEVALGFLTHQRVVSVVINRALGWMIYGFFRNGTLTSPQIWMC